MGSSRIRILESLESAFTISTSCFCPTPSLATGTGLTNYDITYVDGTLTVEAKALTITADDRTKTYGSTLVLGTSAFDTLGLVNGDTVTAVTLTSAWNPPCQELVTLYVAVQLPTGGGGFDGVADGDGDVLGVVGVLVGGLFEPPNVTSLHR